MRMCCSKYSVKVKQEWTREYTMSEHYTSVSDEGVLDFYSLVVSKIETDKRIESE